MRRALVLLALAAAPVAMSGDAQDPTVEAEKLRDVVQPVPSGRINWTRSTLVVEAEGISNTGAWKDVRVIEQSAFSLLEPRMEELARQVRYSADSTAEDLLRRGDGVAQALEENLGSWTVSETRYYGSGRVELVAELDLKSWMRPALMSQAAGVNDTPDGAMRTSGVVVDARGLQVRPALAPRLVGPDGGEIFGARSLSEESASTLSPVIWVHDPAHPEAVERAGDAPVFLRATSVEGGSDLVLDRDDATRLRMLAANGTLLAQARVVVVVDP